jgi:hypothetical protein
LASSLVLAALIIGGCCPRYYSVRYHLDHQAAHIKSACGEEAKRHPIGKDGAGRIYRSCVEAVERGVRAARSK